MRSPRAGNLSCPKAAGKEKVIVQLDGNASIGSETEENSDKDKCEDHVLNQEEYPNGEKIETIVGNRPVKDTSRGEIHTARKVIKRDEGLVQALSLPTISLYNMRSI